MTVQEEIDAINSLRPNALVMCLVQGKSVVDWTKEADAYIEGLKSGLIEPFGVNV